MRKASKIVLLGYMASGKTSVGEKLAIALNRPFIDLDDYIAKKEDLSITEFFDQKGENIFREKELMYLKKLLKKNSSFVLALGGGTPLIKKAMKKINKKSISIYLKATTQTLYNRLAPATVERPLLTHISEGFLEEYIDMHLDKREKKYKKATITVLIDDLTVDEIVEKIILALQQDFKLDKYK